MNTGRYTGRTATVVLLLIASLPFWFIQTNYILSVATLTLIFMVAALGWNIISGFGGQISFGHSIFFGVGAYSTAILESRYHGNAYVGMLLGALVAVVVAILLEWVTVRLRGIYFSLATFALTLIFGILAKHFANFTGGDVGITLPLQGNNPAEFSFTSKLVYYYVGLLFAAIAFAVSWLVLRSRLGLQLRAIQADQDAARACGVRALRVKVIALGYSAILASLAGSVYVQYVQFIDPNSAFGPTIATQIALIAFVGGAGTLWGPVIGAVLLVPLQQLLNSGLSAYPAGFNLVVYAVVVLIVLWIEPRGLMSIPWRRLWPARGRARQDPPAPAESPAASTGSRA
jgi:branched-chain amino acid transport system permease protein